MEIALLILVLTLTTVGVAAVALINFMPDLAHRLIEKYQGLFRYDPYR